MPRMSLRAMFYPLPLAIIAACYATHLLSQHYIESEAYSSASAAAGWRQLITMFISVFMISYLAQFMIFTFGVLVMKMFPGD